MKSSSICRCSVIPIHLLDRLQNHPNQKVRDSARASFLATHVFRERRQLLAEGARFGRPTGELRRTVYDAGSTPILPGRLVRSEDDKKDTQDVAVNEAFKFAGDTFNFYKEVLGRISVDDRGFRLDSTVHYEEEPGQPLDNAMWDGEQMLYGDGDGVLFDRFTKSLDVIAHELTHGVTQFEAGLEYHNQSGALNESMSDVFGITAKQWANEQSIQDADWLIGKDLFLLPGSALRSMKAPGTAYDDPTPDGIGKDPQPGHMKDFLQLPDTRRGDNGGVHVNSGIPNRAYYLACVNLAAPNAWDKAIHIWYDALCNRLGRLSDFEAAKNATVAAAAELYGTAETKAVVAAWKEVGV